MSALYMRVHKVGVSIPVTSCGKGNCSTRTDLGSLDDLVMLERIEIVLDVHWGRLLDDPCTEEGVGRALRRHVLGLLPGRRC